MYEIINKHFLNTDSDRTIQVNTMKLSAKVDNWRPRIGCFYPAIPTGSGLTSEKPGRS